MLVWRLDRWGRSMTDLLATLQELEHLGVGFVSLGLGVSLRSAEVCQNQRCQFRDVPMEGLNCCREHVRLADVLPSDIEAVRLCQVADKLALCSAIAFAEGMQRVQFAEVVGGAIAEGGGTESGKVLFFGKLREHRRGAPSMWA